MAILKNHVVYIIIIAILLILCVNLYASKENNSNRYSNNIISLHDSIKYYKDNYNNIVASQRALAVTNKELKALIFSHEADKKQLKDKLNKFKKAKTVSIIKTVTKLDTIYIPIINNNFKISNKYYKIKGQIYNDSIKLQDISFINKQTLIIGKKRQGLFKKPILTAEITNSNPYVTTNQIKTFTIVYNRKWWENPLYTIPIALSIGYILGK